MANATVHIVENETPTAPIDRLRSAVSRRQVALDAIADAPERVEAKYDRIVKNRAAELKEAKAMIVRARAELKEAKAALDAAEKGDG